jgi:hypothetical protein
MNGIKVSEKIFLNHNSEIVWKIISSKNALELFHPYCLKNDAIDFKKKDKLVYLNGLTYIREFSVWKPNKGFELSIGKKGGKSLELYGKLKSWIEVVKLKFQFSHIVPVKYLNIFIL